MDKEVALLKLKKIRGHIGFVIEMVERDENCLKVLQQSKAVVGGIKKLNIYLLEQYLTKCIFKMKTGKEQQIAIKEIMKLLINESN